MQPYAVTDCGRGNMYHKHMYEAKQGAVTRLTFKRRWQITPEMFLAGPCARKRLTQPINVQLVYVAFMCRRPARILGCIAIGVGKV